MNIKFKRVSGSLPPHNLSEGEPVFTLKDNKLYIGDKFNKPVLINKDVEFEEYEDTDTYIYTYGSIGVLVDRNIICIVDMPNNGEEDILLAPLNQCVEGKTITIKKIGNGRLTVYSQEGEYLDMEGNQSLRYDHPYGYITLVAAPNQNKWFIIGGNVDFS